MKLAIDKFVHEPPGISIIPETEYEAWMRDTAICAIHGAFYSGFAACPTCEVMDLTPNDIERMPKMGRHKSSVDR